MKRVIQFSQTDPDNSSFDDEFPENIIERYKSQIEIKYILNEKCSRPFNEIAINVSGYLFLCHYSFIHHNNDGIRFGKDLIKKYHSDEFNLFRRSFYQQRPDLCKFCPYYPTC